jgi:hypothetical protein
MVQDINSDLSIKDALAREEKFFRTQPVCCSTVAIFVFSYSIFHIEGICLPLLRHIMVLPSTVAYRN